MKSYEVKLKVCSAQDISELMKVAHQSYREHYMYLWENEHYAEWYMARSFGEESLAIQMRDTYALFYLIYYRKKPAGFLKLNLNKAMDGGKDSGSLEVERIYLLAALSGKGIGKEAIQFVLKLAGQKNISTLWLKSMDSSPAVGFYKKMGFRTIGHERLPFEGFRDIYRNMYLMQLTLPVP
jgi:diamine N-acetyltransferase